MQVRHEASELSFFVAAFPLSWKEVTDSFASQQMKGKHQSQILVFPSTGSPLKKKETTPSSRGNSYSQGDARPSFRPSAIHKNKKAHNRKEGTPSFRRRHNMFKLFKQTDYSSEQALYLKEAKQGLTNSLPSEPSFTTSPAATHLPGLMHFLAQHIQGDVAAQGHTSKFPIFQGERNLFT